MITDDFTLKKQHKEMSQDLFCTICASRYIIMFHSCNTTNAKHPSAGSAPVTYIIFLPLCLLCRKQRNDKTGQNPETAHQQTVGPLGDTYTMSQAQSPRGEQVDILMEENLEYCEGNFPGGSPNIAQSQSSLPLSNGDPRMPLLNSPGSDAVHRGIYCVPEDPKDTADQKPSYPAGQGNGTCGQAEEDQYEQLEEFTRDAPGAECGADAVELKQ